MDPYRDFYETPGFDLSNSDSNDQTNPNHYLNEPIYPRRMRWNPTPELDNFQRFQVVGPNRILEWPADPPIVMIPTPHFDPVLGRMVDSTHFDDHQYGGAASQVNHMPNYHQAPSVSNISTDENWQDPSQQHHQYPYPQHWPMHMQQDQHHDSVASFYPYQDDSSMQGQTQTMMPYEHPHSQGQNVHEVGQSSAASSHVGGMPYHSCLQDQAQFGYLFDAPISPPLTSSSSSSEGEHEHLPNEEKKKKKSHMSNTAGQNGLRRANLGYYDIYYAEDVIEPPPPHEVEAKHIGMVDGVREYENGPEERDIRGDAPVDRNMFRKIHLYRNNPDNLLFYMNKLNGSRLLSKNPVLYTRTYERLMQSARAMGWLTNGRFRHKNWTREEQKTRSPAVHAAYLSTRKKTVVLYAKKEQEYRQADIIHAQQIRQQTKRSKGVDEDGFLSRNPRIHHLDTGFQEVHDESEDEQFDNYYDDLRNGRLPRLWHDERTGLFRLTKSKRKQQKTRLYSQAQIDAIPDGTMQEQMKEENNWKMEEKGIFKIMDVDSASSDEEYQWPRTTKQFPHTYDAATFPATPHRATHLDDPSKRWRRNKHSRNTQ